MCVQSEMCVQFSQTSDLTSNHCLCLLPRMDDSHVAERPGVRSKEQVREERKREGMRERERVKREGTRERESLTGLLTLPTTTTTCVPRYNGFSYDEILLQPLARAFAPFLSSFGGKPLKRLNFGLQVGVCLSLLVLFLAEVVLVSCKFVTSAPDL